MIRTIQDQDLLLWEAYATPGDWGLPSHAKIVFQCLTEPERRARVLEREGDTSDVEEELVHATEEELLSLLDEAGELD